MSYHDYEVGRLAREEAARPLAEAIAQQFPDVDPDHAARGARVILDQRVVFTARAYDQQVGRVDAIREVLKAFKGLLDG